VYEPGPQGVCPIDRAAKPEGVLVVVSESVDCDLDTIVSKLPETPFFVKFDDQGSMSDSLCFQPLNGVTFP
jgi:hypothetical protein